MGHRTTAELEAGLDTVLGAPPSEGRLQLVVRRPAPGEREILDEGELDAELGLVGDDWVNRSAPREEAPGMIAQVTVMNARYAQLIAGPDHAEWARAGDQLYVDLDISQANMPPGTRIAVGAAVLEVQEEPHHGCAQFSERFGSDALRLANSPRGRELRLRGVNTMVVQAGTVRPGDPARKL